MKKRIISLLLAVIMACAMIPSAFAASNEATEAADALNALGLFGGTGTDANGKPIYDLDRAPTRQEAVTMLVRLLGKEKEAEAGTWETPFTDVDKWAKPYVGYAYANKLTSGTGATTFGGSATMSATQYITLVLRALGYESGTDFQWDKAWELSDKIGMTDGRYNANSNSFLRADVAIISNNALSVTIKDSSVTLLEDLPGSKIAKYTGFTRGSYSDDYYRFLPELESFYNFESMGKIEPYVTVGGLEMILGVATQSYDNDNTLSRHQMMIYHIDEHEEDGYEYEILKYKGFWRWSEKEADGNMNSANPNQVKKKFVVGDSAFDDTCLAFATTYARPSQYTSFDIKTQKGCRYVQFEGSDLINANDALKFFGINKEIVFLEYGRWTLGSVQ